MMVTVSGFGDKLDVWAFERNGQLGAAVGWLLKSLSHFG